MKTLLLMRHAKSSWKDESLSDEARPLKRRGRRAAAKMGTLIAEQQLLPDLILCSTAARAVETCDLAKQHWPAPVECWFLSELYACPLERFPEILRQVPDDIQRVLLIGHNPELAEFLARAAGVDDKFPTAALAWLELDVPVWKDLSSKPAMQLKKLWRPRDLD